MTKYDLSNPKPVAPDFVEAYHLKQNNQVGIKWRRNPEGNIIGYNVFMGHTPHGPWIKISLSIVSALEFVQIISKNLNVEHYFCVQAVNDSFIMSDLSVPKKLSVELEIKEHIHYPVQEIRRRTKWLCEQRGEYIDLWQRKYTGERCSCCIDTMVDGKTGCNICFGTSFIGGYYDPIRLGVSLELSPVRQIIDKHGLEIEDNPKGWTIWEPILHDRDVLVTDDNARFEIKNVQKTQGKGREIIRQKFELVKLNPTNIIYSLAKTEIEAITAATLEEEKTGIISEDRGVFEGTFGKEPGKDVVGGRKADGTPAGGFIRHSNGYAKGNNILTEDATIERGHQGYQPGIRHNIGKWTGYITNRLGNVINKDESIMLYSSDSIMKAKSRPDSSWVFSEGSFEIPKKVAFEYSCEMNLTGSGYFYYESVGMASIDKYLENQLADRLWYKKTDNIHFGLGAGDIFGKTVRAFVFCNDEMIQQKQLEDFDFKEKHWLKLRFNGTSFIYYIDDIEVITCQPEDVKFDKFRVVMSAGTWSGTDVQSDNKPAITESFVNVFRYKSNMPSPVRLYKPEINRQLFDSHIVATTAYQGGNILTAEFRDNFNQPELNTDFWKISHLADGHEVAIKNRRLAFSGVSLHDDVNIMTWGSSIRDLTQGADNESFIYLKSLHTYVSKMTVEAKVGCGGRGKSHNIITLNSALWLKGRASRYAVSYGIFFENENMVSAGFCINDGWENTTKIRDIGNPYLQKMKIVYDFQNKYSEFFVNDELLFSRSVNYFVDPIVILSAGNCLKHQSLLNVFDDFKVSYTYLDKDVDALDLQY